ncbi:DMT family transporter [Terrimonas pollutisoli]|uniref:DMT family transporter n=1 Tax=Terrimonas pollutisoli TaxID=3034147 RepID=UPI0023EDB954|nr:DMT family transporter [Terrimonas sp. H1YJ31]
MHTTPAKNVYIGIGLALLAVIIWSGNFIAARGVIKQIPPVSLAFYRWLTAAIIIIPFVIKRLKTEWKIVKRSGGHLFWAALTGIALFNTFVYIGAHYSTAINLALIGTTSSPIIAIVLARIFLNEKIGQLKIAGMLLCLAGVLYLLSKGNISNLLNFRFTAGDGWILLAAFCFAVYNTLVKRKPVGLSPVNYLAILFCIGTLLLFPFYLWEISHAPKVEWNINLLLVIIYLGLGTSVISFLCWNLAIGKLGAGRTALFGNLIPVFSSIEAALILHEEFTTTHIISMLLVFTGIVIANLKLAK